MLIIWDRINIHRSALVNEFIASTRGRIITEFLPAYAPELNPVEYVWGHWKQYLLPNFCPETFEILETKSRSTLARVRRKKSRITAFFAQAHLPF